MKSPGELARERARNRADTIRHARWEAEMVKRLGARWFEARDKWLAEALEADREAWRDPAVRKALIKAILATDKTKKTRRTSSNA
ncbi:MAG: hypothetical protein F7B17_00515 [Desulfurococcales archaeon]|nr:hypothetical protein [Desulfurococcales archaeon]